jgi:hypothetical protein
VPRWGRLLPFHIPHFVATICVRLIIVIFNRCNVSVRSNSPTFKADKVPVHARRYRSTYSEAQYIELNGQLHVSAALRAVPLSRRLAGPRRRYGHLGEKNLFSCWVRTAISVAPSAYRSRYAYCAVPNTNAISRLSLSFEVIHTGHVGLNYTNGSYCRADLFGISVSAALATRSCQNAPACLAMLGRL